MSVETEEIPLSYDKIHTEYHTIYRNLDTAIRLVDQYIDKYGETVQDIQELRTKIRKIEDTTRNTTLIYKPYEKRIQLYKECNEVLAGNTRTIKEKCTKQQTKLEEKDEKVRNKIAKDSETIVTDLQKWQEKQENNLKSKHHPYSRVTYVLSHTEGTHLTFKSVDKGANAQSKAVITLTANNPEYLKEEETGATIDKSDLTNE